MSQSPSVSKKLLQQLLFIYIHINALNICEHNCPYLRSGHTKDLKVRFY